jgi:adenosine deaminase
VETFAEVIAWARAHGLHFLPHAGETGGAVSIWKALELGAERIGHGIQAVDDPELVKHLAARRIPLEISITSNLRTGAAASLAAHPLRRLWEAGVPVTLNTDDPGMFHTTLTAEYELARTAFGFGDTELRAIADNAFRFAMSGS